MWFSNLTTSTEEAEADSIQIWVRLKSLRTEMLALNRFLSTANSDFFLNRLSITGLRHRTVDGLKTNVVMKCYYSVSFLCRPQGTELN